MLNQESSDKQVVSVPRYRISNSSQFERARAEIYKSTKDPGERARRLTELLSGAEFNWADGKGTKTSLFDFITQSVAIDPDTDPVVVRSIERARTLVDPESQDGYRVEIADGQILGVLGLTHPGIDPSEDRRARETSQRIGYGPSNGWGGSDVHVGPNNGGANKV